MKLTDLLSIMLINRSNFEVLHWRVKGRHFDNVHNNVTANYYDMLSKDLDDVAEMGMRLGLNPVNYLDAYRIAKTAIPEIIIVDANRDYTRDEVIAITDKLLNEILMVLQKIIFSDEMQNVQSNVGIKAALEGMYDKYDKEYRFLNARRK